MIRKLMIGLCLGLLLTACVKADDVAFMGVRNVEMKKSTASQALVVVSVELRNDSRAKITLKSAELTLQRAEQVLLEVSVDEPVTLPKRAVSTIDIPIRARFRGPFGALGLIPLLSEKGQQDVVANGTIRIKAGSASRTLRIDQMSLKELMRLLDMDDLRQYMSF